MKHDKQVHGFTWHVRAVRRSGSWLMGLDPHTVRVLLGLAGFLVSFRLVLWLRPWRWLLPLVRRG